MKESLCKLTVLLLLLALFPSSLLAGEVLYYHTDNFGTPMAMTDKTGKVVWRADELPFGEQYQTEEDPVRNNVRFLGKRYDPESGLICMGKRYLDPKSGRFTQPDPVGLVDPATGKVNHEMLLNPQRLNRYVYALNNPYKYVDPEGLSAKHRPGMEYQDELEGGGFRLGGGPRGSFLKNTKVTKGTGKFRNKPPAPLKEADGRPHSIIEKPGKDGQYTTHYGDGTWKQYRGSGKDHGGVPRPNVKEAGKNVTPDGREFIDKGRVRPPRPDEIPGG